MQNYSKIQKFLHNFVLSKKFINKSLFEIEKIIYSDMEYVTYTLQFYEQETCERMRDIIHHMCTTLLLKPTPLMVENILGAMFNVRNRYDMNIPHTSTHWTRKWGQTLNKSYNMCMRQ